MNKETQHLIDSLQSAYDGNPWFGRSIKAILAEVDPEIAIKKPEGQHSILELLYHMINWRAFTISRLKPEAGKNSNYFGKLDWQKLDHADPALWEKGLELLDSSQKQLISLIKKLPEEKLSEIVAERKYDFRYLLYGIIQHDIYHLGQIAYVKKLLE